MATARGAPRWTSFTPDSSGRAISCSTSVRTWATGSRPFAGSARGWLRSSRNPRWSPRYGRDRAVAIEPVAVGRGTGTIELRLNVDNPTVSTASPEFVQAADGAPGWEGQAWGKILRVPVTTLDALILRHGAPAFIKIDVEGFEAEALAALTRPVPALSFEFTTIQRDVAAACVERCAALGYASFNAALGESQVFAHATWQGAPGIARWLETLPDAANSGDVYARLL
jgi:FkbM family methyltransferase